jgi:hypothetical protein
MSRTQQGIPAARREAITSRTKYSVTAAALLIKLSPICTQIRSLPKSLQPLPYFLITSEPFSV